MTRLSDEALEVSARLVEWQQELTKLVELAKLCDKKIDQYTNDNIPVAAEITRFFGLFLKWAGEE